ncbi:ash family protein [Kluyvera sp. STS39-E]|uniref:ash family protein n=1 Tax=Kluyvera sp. STS39-E TaxID=3234748 RepID=UPI0034C5D4CB
MYRIVVPAKSGAGIGTLLNFIDDICALALFLCRAHAHISMVGQAGASQDAPVSMRPVVPTPSGSATNEIGTSGGGHSHHSSEAAPWQHPSPQPSRTLPTANSIH